MMTKHEYTKQRDEILLGLQIRSNHTVKSVFALIFSGVISTYGIYSILLSMGIEDNAMNIALGVFVLILIVADTFKRGALVKYFNSQIRQEILTTSKVLKMQLAISLLALSFMTVFDIVGAFSTANFTEQKYQDFRATSSKEFELLEQNAENGKTELSIYSQELTAWQNNKADAYAVCDQKWNGWKAKYKADCKSEWEKSNPKPTKPETGTSVRVDDFKDVKESANGDFLSNYIFYIILFLSVALTLLLQYTTISEITDDKDAIGELLTPMLIGILQDRLKELEANYVQHETERNELISTADRREKELGRDFEERGKAIALLSLTKAVDARGQTVQRIANNETFPHGNKKAGFVLNPLYGGEPLNGAVITDDPKTAPKEQADSDPLNESVKRSRYNGAEPHEPCNGAVITDDGKTINFELFSKREHELINLLWANGAVKRSKALTPRDTVLQQIGNNKTNTMALRDLYSKLLSLGYVYRRIGYFANVELA